MDNTVNQSNDNGYKPVENIYKIIALVVLAVLIFGAIYMLVTKKNEENTANNTTSTSIKTPLTDGQQKQAGDQNQYHWSTMNQGPYKDSVSYATSKDALVWVDSDKTLVAHASVPDAIVKDGVIMCYFVDVATDGVAEKIGLIKSTDNGLTWSAKQNIVISGIGTKVAVDPDPFLLPDGKIRLYYFDINEGRSAKSAQPPTNKIYAASSTDGINFIEELNAVFVYQDIYDPDVIKVGDEWRMYVGTGSNKVLSATSSDGLTFTYEGIAAEGSAVPNVIVKGNIYYLYTAGIDIWSSADGKTFTKTTNRFVKTSGLAADPGVVKLADGSYIMLYKTKPMDNPPPK